MKQPIIITPAALYARVSSGRQDVDLSVAARLRALAAMLRRTATLSLASTWMRLRAAESSTGPSSGKCLTRLPSHRPLTRGF